jgi:hypothetical protein
MEMRPTIVPDGMIGKTIGNYLVRDKFGEGGVGSVCLVRSCRLHGDRSAWIDRAHGIPFNAKKGCRPFRKSHIVRSIVLDWTTNSVLAAFSKAQYS